MNFTLEGATAGFKYYPRNLLRDTIVYKFEDRLFFDRIWNEVEVRGNCLDNPGSRDISTWIPPVTYPKQNNFFFLFELVR